MATTGYVYTVHYIATFGSNGLLTVILLTLFANEVYGREVKLIYLYDSPLQFLIVYAPLAKT